LGLYGSELTDASGVIGALWRQQVTGSPAWLGYRGCARSCQAFVTGRSVLRSYKAIGAGVGKVRRWAGINKAC
jgi:hypothetical protein